MYVFYPIPATKVSQILLEIRVEITGIAWQPPVITLSAHVGCGGHPFSVFWVERYSPVTKTIFIFYVLLFACGNIFCFWYNRLKVMEDELIQASTKKFSLEKFYKEPSVSSKQMVDCCKRLLGQSLPYLQGMHLCVSHFYSVMQDGDLCIPWNWKNGDTMKWHKSVLFFKEVRSC